MKRHEGLIMRKFLLAATSCAALMSANPASAAALLFDFVGNNPADNLSFMVDSNPTPTNVFSTSFSVDTIFTTPTGTEAGEVDFYDITDGGGFATFLPISSSFADLAGPQLFTGSLASPTLAPGVFNLTFFATGDAAGTLTISSATAAVPEPGTWLLMILGFGAIGASLRSRQKSTNLSVSYS
jgi:hypothetical protein